MSKTKALRKLVREQLQTIPGTTYSRKAPPDATFPYKTYVIRNASFMDARDDLLFEVDVWDKATDQKTAEDIADQIEALFSNANIPAPPIYPTFFRDGRDSLDDPDATIQHIQLHFLVQLYEEE